MHTSHMAAVTTTTASGLSPVITSRVVTATTSLTPVMPSHVATGLSPVIPSHVATSLSPVHSPRIDMSPMVSSRLAIVENNANRKDQSIKKGSNTSLAYYAMGGFVVVLFIIYRYVPSWMIAMGVGLFLAGYWVGKGTWISKTSVVCSRVRSWNAYFRSVCSFMCTTGEPFESIQHATTIVPLGRSPYSMLAWRVNRLVCGLIVHNEWCGGR